MNTPSAADQSGQIPDAAIPALARAATVVATGHGDSHTASITAVASSHSRAVEYSSQGNQIAVGRDDPVYLVRMQGEFFHNMPRPHGTALPSGRFLFVVFDARTLRVTDISLSGSDHRPPMSALGLVTNLLE